MSSTSSSLLLPNLAQLVADLLIAAGPPAAVLTYSVIFSVHMLTPSTSLILKHVVGSASGAQRNDWQSRSSSSTRGSVRSLALRGRAARAVCARTQQSMLTLAVRPAQTSRPGHLAQACQDGAPGGAREQPFASKQAYLLLTWGCCTAQGPYLGRVHARLKAVIRIYCRGTD